MSRALSTSSSRDSGATRVRQKNAASSAWCRAKHHAVSSLVAQSTCPGSSRPKASSQRRNPSWSVVGGHRTTPRTYRENAAGAARTSEARTTGTPRRPSSRAAASVPHQVGSASRTGGKGAIDIDGEERARTVANPRSTGPMRHRRLRPHCHAVSRSRFPSTESSTETGSPPATALRQRLRRSPRARFEPCPADSRTQRALGLARRASPGRLSPAHEGSDSFRILLVVLDVGRVALQRPGRRLRLAGAGVSGPSSRSRWTSMPCSRCFRSASAKTRPRSRCAEPRGGRPRGARRAPPSSARCASGTHEHSRAPHRSASERSCRRA